jgi:hypothetical protein
MLKPAGCALAFRLAEDEPSGILDQPGLLGGQQRSIHVAVRPPRLCGRIALLLCPDEPSG